MKKILKFPLMLIEFVLEVVLIPVAWVFNKLTGMFDE